MPNEVKLLPCPHGVLRFLRCYQCEEDQRCDCDEIYPAECEHCERRREEDEVKLKPCAYCGGTDIAKEDNGHAEWLRCNHCGATGPWIEPPEDHYFTGTELADQWNHRPTTVVTDEVVERVAMLVEALKPFAAIGDNFSIPGGWADTDRVELSHGFRVLDKVPVAAFRNARKALASMPTVVTGEQPQGWLPIESAPSEEFVHVILIARDGRGNGTRGVMPALFDGECWQSISLAGLMPFVNPTHWQPLPEPPAQPEVDTGDHALPPSGLRPCGSQAKPVAAIARSTTKKEK